MTTADYFDNFTTNRNDGKNPFIGADDVLDDVVTRIGTTLKWDYATTSPYQLECKAMQGAWAQVEQLKNVPMLIIDFAEVASASTMAVLFCLIRERKDAGLITCIMSLVKTAAQLQDDYDCYKIITLETLTMPQQ